MRDGEEPLPANQLVQRPWRGEAGKGGGSGWKAGEWWGAGRKKLLAGCCVGGAVQLREKLAKW